jgi:rhodanese-related sulfurtransferase
MDFLKKLLGLDPGVNLADVAKRGAQVLDVRTQAEYASGHIKGSLHIPLDQLPQRLNQLKKDKPIITCCASGMRSGSAKRLLKSQGFVEVYNGGGWLDLQGKLKH